uniref:Uncharacterized protein n=1 Tax=Anguilla anguilla TaxID=7936 RepID=A0A0E9WMJ5_ANGAN
MQNRFMFLISKQILLLHLFVYLPLKTVVTNPVPGDLPSRRFSFKP